MPVWPAEPLQDSHFRGLVHKSLVQETINKCGKLNDSYAFPAGRKDRKGSFFMKL